MKIVYPALFTPLEKGTGYCVAFPDLPGCVTEGDSLAEAIEMAVDAASGWVLDELEDGNPVPEASRREDIPITEPQSFVNLVVLDMDSYAEKYGQKAVRKKLHNSGMAEYPRREKKESVSQKHCRKDSHKS